MITVYKYKIHTVESQVIDMPAGARILTAADQAGMFCLWALVDTNKGIVSRRIYIKGTGHVVPELSEYVATIHQSGFVRHIFARRE